MKAEWDSANPETFPFVLKTCDQKRGHFNKYLTLSFFSFNSFRVLQYWKNGSVGYFHYHILLWIIQLVIERKINKSTISDCVHTIHSGGIQQKLHPYMFPKQPFCTAFSNILYQVCILEAAVQFYWTSFNTSIFIFYSTTKFPPE